MQVDKGEKDVEFTVQQSSSEAKKFDLSKRSNFYRKRRRNEKNEEDEETSTKDMNDIFESIKLGKHDKHKVFKRNNTISQERIIEYCFTLVKIEFFGQTNKEKVRLTVYSN